MMTDFPTLQPGATIGILGGGQLGRMLATAAAKLGMKTHIFCPDPQSPAFEVTPHKTVADYTDKKALQAFADAVDIITYEFENVPVETAQFLEKTTAVAPGPRALSISQDRLEEKRFLTMNEITVADYRPVSSLADLEKAVGELGLPAILKTTRLGYDGKGQRTLRSKADCVSAFAALGANPLVLEAFVPFEREISVIVARNPRGQASDFEPAENVHKNHILKTSTVPANIDKVTAGRASRIAQQIAGALDYVGVMGVEFFVVPGDPRPTLLVNEIAPRVHNSGHWTQDVCLTDQFEQHIRAICAWPLGDNTRLARVQMENLIGDEINNISARLRPGDQPHIYGKLEARPGRKMGHINHILPDKENI